MSAIQFEAGTVYRTFSGKRYRCAGRTEHYASMVDVDTEQSQRKQITVIYDERAQADVEVVKPDDRMVKASDPYVAPAKKKLSKNTRITMRDGTVYEEVGRTWRKTTVLPDGRTMHGAHAIQPATKKDRRRARRGDPYRSRSGAMLQVVDGQIKEVDA